MAAVYFSFIGIQLCVDVLILACMTFHGEDLPMLFKTFPWYDGDLGNLCYKSRRIDKAEGEDDDLNAKEASMPFEFAGIMDRERKISLHYFKYIWRPGRFFNFAFNIFSIFQSLLQESEESSNERRFTMAFGSWKWHLHKSKEALFFNSSRNACNYYAEGRGPFRFYIYDILSHNLIKIHWLLQAHIGMIHFPLSKSFSSQLLLKP